jgi:hypothetical protein
MNDCETCEWMEFPHDDGYCYMFREQPQGECCQHTKYHNQRQHAQKLLRRMPGPARVFILAQLLSYLKDKP